MSNIIKVGLKRLGERILDTTDRDLRHNLMGRRKGMTSTVDILISEIESRLKKGDISLKSFLDYLKW